MNEVKMESICTEFSTVLDRLQAKDCYLVVSAQQATVLQQVSAFRRHMEQESSRHIVWGHLRGIRDTLEKVVQDSPSTKFKTFWQNFHVVSTTVLPNLWCNLARSIQASIDALTYQAVSRQWAEMLLPRFSKDSHDNGELFERAFGPEEEKAIMYASGFVVRKLQRKYSTIDTPLAAEITETLMNLLSDGKYTDADSCFEDFLQEWFQDVDRGGLSLVSPSTFTLFKCIESIAYKNLQCMFDHSNDKRDTQSGTVAVVCTNEHVQFLWATISLDISCEQNRQTLLKEIVELWVTMRGHSMASMVSLCLSALKALHTRICNVCLTTRMTKEIRSLVQ